MMCASAMITVGLSYGRLFDSDLYVCCFDSLMSPSYIYGPNNLYVCESQRAMLMYNRFKSSGHLLLIALFWFIIIVIFIGFLFVNNNATLV